MATDTLTIARGLRDADIPTLQAEAIAAAIGRSSADSLESAATKSDVALVRIEIATSESRLEAKIESVQSKLIMWFVSSQVALAAVIIAGLKL